MHELVLDDVFSIRYTRRGRELISRPGVVSCRARSTPYFSRWFAIRIPQRRSSRDIRLMTLRLFLQMMFHVET